MERVKEIVTVSEIAKEVSRKVIAMAEDKYRHRYSIGKTLYKLWETGQYRSKRRMCEEVYREMSIDAQKEVSIGDLRNWLCFYQYWKDKIEWIKKLRIVYDIIRSKSCSSLEQSQQYPLAKYMLDNGEVDPGELKKIEETLLKFSGSLERVHEFLEEYKDGLFFTPGEDVNWRLMWHIYWFSIDRIRIVQAIAYVKRNKGMSNHAIIRQYIAPLSKRRGLKKMTYCYSCGEMLDDMSKGIDWNFFPHHITCMKEDLERAIKRLPKYSEERGILELLLEDLISRYNLEGEEE